MINSREWVCPGIVICHLSLIIDHCDRSLRARGGPGSLRNDFAVTGGGRGAGENDGSRALLTPIRQFRRLGLPGGGRSALPHWLVTVTRTRHQWCRVRSRVEGALGPHRVINSAEAGARPLAGRGLRG